jgi:HEAT repeat protein
MRYNIEEKANINARCSQKKYDRAQRGEISPGFERQFEHESDESLIHLLRYADAQIRTSAATLLGRRTCRAAIPQLCEGICNETAIYARLAMSEALGAIGEPALPELTARIGTVGHNQHQTLPTALFKKWNYPLPRDLVVRTIVKIGTVALPSLIKHLQTCTDHRIISEVIDAIGYLSFYSGDHQAFDACIKAYATYSMHVVIMWKLIRAFQAFPAEETVGYLKEVLLTSPLPQHRWEAARSLGQIGTHRAQEVLHLATHDQHPLVADMVQRSLHHIRAWEPGGRPSRNLGDVRQ